MGIVHNEGEPIVIGVDEAIDGGEAASFNLLRAVMPECKNLSDAEIIEYMRDQKRVCSVYAKQITAFADSLNMPQHLGMVAIARSLCATLVRHAAQTAYRNSLTHSQQQDHLSAGASFAAGYCETSLGELTHDKAKFLDETGLPEDHWLPCDGHANKDHDDQEGE